MFSSHVNKFFAWIQFVHLSEIRFSYTNDYYRNRQRWGIHHRVNYILHIMNFSISQNQKNNICINPLVLNLTSLFGDFFKQRVKMGGTAEHHVIKIQIIEF